MGIYASGTQNQAKGKDEKWGDQKEKKKKEISRKSYGNAKTYKKDTRMEFRNVKVSV